MEDQNSYGRLKDRLEEIVVSVRQKDLSLEKSLDLYEEALRLGGRCVELIDRTDFTAEELEAVGWLEEDGVTTEEPSEAAAGATGEATEAVTVEESITVVEENGDEVVLETAAEKVVNRSAAQELEA